MTQEIFIWCNFVFDSSLSLPPPFSYPVGIGLGTELHVPAESAVTEIEFSNC